MERPVGILALQGDYAKHAETFAGLGAPTRLVRRPDELDDCRGLVIPGGESTTLARLIDRCGLRGALTSFAGERPVLGTCAGLILLARSLAPDPGGDHGVTPLGLLDCVVQRNGFGRQVDSFSEPLSLAALDGRDEPFPAVFIRAPRILEVGAGAEIVGRRDREPVAVRQGRLLGLTFHPELTADARVHAAFLDL